MDFTNKNVLVTGGTRGIGLAISKSFAQSGANVGMVYRTNDHSAQNSLKTLGEGNHLLLKADLSNPETRETIISEFLTHYRSIDILINNAGISIPHQIEACDLYQWQTAWRQTFETNLFAIADLSFIAAKEMMKTGGGRIVNVSSRGAYRGEPAKPAYGSSKAALNSLSQSLAKALAPHHIYVSAVAPGFTDTEMGATTLTPVERERLLAESPFKRMAKPEEVAHAVLFLASEGAEYSSGTIIDVNGASYLR